MNAPEAPTNAMVRAGETVGAYRIGSLLGRGGMGEVYRAHDSKLQRDVAIKILPSAFANDPERLSRFHREARLLASLNHPNIASIYGFEDSGNVHALVMELVEGPTLAERIRQGPMDLDEALPIARQICDALEYAHEEGVVHRDLKPANIKVAPNGAVKTLDFGLAKVLAADASTDISNSPTLTPIATQSGILLGTPAYMSPEQARGKRVDRRADIWAFGCVLFEMLAGRSAFHGETVTDTLAAVIGAQPDWSLLPVGTPQQIRTLLRRCLQGDPRRRLQAIGEGRIALEEALSGDAPPEPATNRTRRGAFWIAAALAVLLIAATGGLVVWNLMPVPRSLPVTRFTITFPPGQQFTGTTGSAAALALSPDASQLVYAATQGGVQRIYRRSMDQGDTSPIPGTEGGNSPFFSPDGQWLGFVADGKLKKISIRGGVAQVLTDVGAFYSSASWGGEHTIVFAPYSSVLQQISDEGGGPQPVTRFEKSETLHLWPQFLPGGKAVLFSPYTSGPTGIAVQRINGERRTLVQGQQATMPSYVSGRLVFAQAGQLMAVPFDVNSLQVKKDAVPAAVISGIVQSEASGVTEYSVSATGTLVYISGNTQQRKSELVWVDRRDHKEHSVGVSPRYYNQPRVSPDGARIAVDVVETAEKVQVWLYDLARETFTPFTFEGTVNRHSVWSPDSKWLVFMSNKEGATQIFWKPADGSGRMERLTTNRLTAAGDILQIPYSLTLDGMLTFIKLVRPTEAEFLALPVGDPTKSQHVGQEQRLPIERAVIDGGPQLSRDGRWLAYASDESGQRQIYLQAFSGPGSKQQISTDGGNEPQWNPNSRELFYRSGDKMMAVSISPQGLPEGKPQVLFQGSYVPTFAGWVRPNYDVSSDGQRFLMLKLVGEAQPLTEIHVVLNWAEELKHLVPTDGR